MSVYFDQDIMVPRQILLWAIATRRQSRRWERLLADYISASLRHEELSDSAVWEAETEHHLTLIAARNLMRAADMAKPGPVIDPAVRAELIETRDLHEHWDENMPLFNRHPQTGAPKYRSGKDFAARHPGQTPYWWLRWNSADGASLSPGVTAIALHEVVDACQTYALATAPSLASFIAPEPPSPWLSPEEDDRYRGERGWPRPSA